MNPDELQPRFEDRKFFEQHLNSDNCQGWFAARTNDVQFNKVNVFPKMRGNVDFWLGVARGMQLKMEGV